MRIGSSIGLIIIGAILAFAVSDSIQGVDLTLIGYIVMAGGTLGLILSLILSGRRSTTTVQQSGPAGMTEQRTERRMSTPPEDL